MIAIAKQCSSSCLGLTEDRNKPGIESAGSLFHLHGLSLPLERVRRVHYKPSAGAASRCKTGTSGRPTCLQPSRRYLPDRALPQWFILHSHCKMGVGNALPVCPVWRTSEYEKDSVSVLGKGEIWQVGQISSYLGKRAGCLSCSWKVRWTQTSKRDYPEGEGEA